MDSFTLVVINSCLVNSGQSIFWRIFLLYLPQLLIPAPSCRYSEIAALSAHAAYLLKYQQISNKGGPQGAGKYPQWMTAPVSKVFFLCDVGEKARDKPNELEWKWGPDNTQVTKTHIPHVLLQWLLLVTGIVFYGSQQNWVFGVKKGNEDSRVRWSN